MTDAEMLRGMADWLDGTSRRSLVDTLGMGAGEPAFHLRRIADGLGPESIPGLRERLETAKRERDRIAQMLGDARNDLSAAERERVDTTARANAALAKAGDEAGRLREERDELYAVVGRITIAEWRARHEADE